MQRSRVHVESSNTAVSTNEQILYTVDETNGVNIHGLRIGFIAEPENVDANAWGMWVLWCIPDPVSAVPSITTTVLEAEGSNPYIWAMGVWAASNQTPYCLPETNLGTTRNCQKGARIVLDIRREGVSAGNVRITGFIRCFTSSL